MLFFRSSAILLFFVGCQVKEESISEDTGETHTIDCVTEWSHENEIWIDPKLCIAWSQRSMDASDWNSAGQYCQDLFAGGFTEWRLPTSQELSDLSLRDHPFTETTGDLWSSTIDASGLIETINLEQPGMTILLDQSSAAFAYCVFP